MRKRPIGPLEPPKTRDWNRLTNTPVGYAFRTSDNQRVVQFRSNGFTCNWLRPYAEWSDLRDMAVRMWQIYLGAAQPDQVVRLGLRYINHLELPVPRDDFAEYLTAQPNIPAALPQTLMSFFTRVAIQDEGIDCVAVVTQAFEGIINPKVFPLILDIDASKLVNLQPNSDEIWILLDQLRDFKNRIFFESLTEDAVRVFE